MQNVIKLAKKEDKATWAHVIDETGNTRRACSWCLQEALRALRKISYPTSLGLNKIPAKSGVGKATAYPGDHRAPKRTSD